MFAVSNIYGVIWICFVFFYASDLCAKEYLVEADIDARSEYNSNIFLTNLPHDSTKGVIVTPSLSGVVQEKNWDAKFGARVRSHNYSDSNLDSNDQYYDFIGRYIAERDIFSLNVNYDLASNLNSTSTDFGVVGRRINTKNQSITPQYTRLLSERAVLMLSYTYRDVDFLEAENTGFTPYITKSGSGSLVYDLTEKDKLTIGLSMVDYTSKNELVTYKLFSSRIGVEHEFSETLSGDFTLGVSKRTSTNLQTFSYDFLGQPITINQVIDANDRGLLLDVGVKKVFERGRIEGRVSRDNVTDSFGGLNEIDRFTINYINKLSSIWRYKISGRFEDIASISSDSTATDRRNFFFESIVYYSISGSWNVNASYRYIQRKFKSDISGDRAPHSNRIFVGVTYNFSPLSTF